LPRVGCPGGQILGSLEGIFRDDQPDTQHCAQAPALPKYPGLQLPIGGSGQHRSCLHGELPHHYVPSIIMDVLGITEDVFCIIMDVLGVTEYGLGIIADILGITTDILGIVMDFPRPLIHSLLYRNLQVVSKDHSGTDSSYLIICDGISQFLGESAQGFGIIDVA
jgi:hypothetical protein